MLNPEHSQALLEACPTGVLALDPAGRIHWINPALADYLGAPPDRLIGRSRDELPQPHLRALFDLPELLCVPDAEGPRYLRCAPARVGTLQVGFFVDATAQHAVEEEIQHLAELVREHVPRDPLTGLLNERGVLQDLERQVARTRRYGNPLSVLAMAPRAVDPEAAEAEARLVGIARMLRDQVRWADTIGRVEDTAEFVLVLPETDAASARGLAAKLRDRLGALELPDGGRVAVEADFGVAEWRSGDDQRRLLRRAREALLDAAAPDA